MLLALVVLVFWNFLFVGAETNYRLKLSFSFDCYLLPSFLQLLHGCSITSYYKPPSDDSVIIRTRFTFWIT